MTEHDIESIETALAVRLPREYRAAVCPFPVRAFIGNADSQLWDNASKLIELNLELQRDGKWPKHFFAIGAMDDGTTSAIDLNSPELAVWWIDRDYDALGTGPEANDFVEWATEFVRQLRSGEFMDGFDPENDPPGTRARIVPIRLRHWMVCAAVIVLIAVIVALIASS